MFYDEYEGQDRDRLPVSGRLRETYQHFDNVKDAKIFCDDTGIVPDEEKLSYFKQYATDYFQGDFIRGQGAEELLELAGRYQPIGSYLDLGSGPTGLFWCLPLSHAESFTFSDVITEALLVLMKFRRDRNYPDCYRQAMNFIQTPEVQLDNVFDLPADFAVFDCFSPWPAFIRDHQYARISAYGVLSICVGELQYSTAVRQVAENLETNGIFLGADWIRHSKFRIAEDGNDTSYLDANVIKHAIVDANLEVRELETITITDDPLYGHIVLWVAEKRGLKVG